MPTWNTEQYLRFVNERTRPCRDLVTAIAVEAPRRIVDLGCGPGNSTAVLAARWPAAEITGLDNSEAMITEARRNAPDLTWPHYFFQRCAPMGPQSRSSLSPAPRMDCTGRRIRHPSSVQLSRGGP
jgi:trans-aconitate 2-methyltransferase